MSFVDVIPGLVLGLREGLEAFLVIGIMMGFLDKLGRPDLRASVRSGLILGLVGSAAIGVGLWGLSLLLGEAGGSVGKIWESVASLAGLTLLSTFVYWMMKHGKSVVGEVQGQVDSNLSRIGVLGLAIVVVLREGAEIALFAFSSVDQQSYVLGVLIGVVFAAVLAYLISKSLVRVNPSILFTVTLVYLVLQAGYLLGYAVHELFSALAAAGSISEGSLLLQRPFEFQNTVLDHKVGVLGVFLNVAVGWYSRPEWIPFILHYGYVAGMFILWRRVLRRSHAKEGAHA